MHKNSENHLIKAKHFKKQQKQNCKRMLSWFSKINQKLDVWITLNKCTLIKSLWWVFLCDAIYIPIVIRIYSFAYCCCRCYRWLMIMMMIMVPSSPDLGVLPILSASLLLVNTISFIIFVIFLTHALCLSDSGNK